MTDIPPLVFVNGYLGFIDGCHVTINVVMRIVLSMP
jgi:hypothetical protein